ncbi:MAG: hypothetical protein N3B11_06240, partial [Coriobacteriia bacterium]|nr:hypothetical protein [Coriobacteriia bacterium]
MSPVEAPDTPAPDSSQSGRGDAELRNRIDKALQDQGFLLTADGTLIPPDVKDKESLRRLHRAAVEAGRSRAEKTLRRHETRLLSRFARGADIDVTR